MISVVWSFQTYPVFRRVTVVVCGEETAASDYYPESGAGNKAWNTTAGMPRQVPTEFADVVQTTVSV